MNRSYWTFPGIDNITPEEIFKKICISEDADPETVKKSRKYEYVIIKQMYCYIARKMTMASFKEIGEVIDKDHATVLYSCNKIEDHLGIGYKSVKNLYNKINKIL